MVPMSTVFAVMILFLIVGGIQTIDQAIDDFFSVDTLENVPSIIALILIFVCIKISFDNLEEKEGWEGLSKIYKVLLWIFLPIGAIFYYELYILDVNKNCFGWFGKYVPSYLLALLVSYVIVTVFFIVINHTREAWITSTCCVLQVVAIVGIYLVIANVCTSSYAAGAAKQLAADEAIQYVITQPVKARYPSLTGDKEKFAPTFLPLKWVAADLEEGDIVYSSEDIGDQERILISDGEKSGYVDTSCLEKCEKQFHYMLVINSREENVPLYEEARWVTRFWQSSLSSGVIQYLKPGESVQKIGPDGGVGHGLDYIKVETESGVQGYLSSRYVDIVKTPVIS